MKVTYHGQKWADWCPLLMANRSVFRVRGLDPFSGEIRDLPRQQCKPVSTVLVVFREGEAFSSASGDVAIEGKWC